MGIAFDIDEVRFPKPVEAKIRGRCVTEEELYEALTATADLGDEEALIARRVEGLRGGEGFWVLCRVPSSGRYLSLALR